MGPLQSWALFLSVVGGCWHFYNQSSAKVRSGRSPPIPDERLIRGTQRLEGSTKKKNQKRETQSGKSTKKKTTRAKVQAVSEVSQTSSGENVVLDTELQTKSVPCQVKPLASPAVSEKAVPAVGKKTKKSKTKNVVSTNSTKPIIVMEDEPSASQGEFLESNKINESSLSPFSAEQNQNGKEVDEESGWRTVPIGKRGKKKPYGGVIENGNDHSDTGASKASSVQDVPVARNIPPKTDNFDAIFAAFVTKRHPNDSDWRVV